MTQTDSATDPVNDVRIVGRLSAAPEARELPSGDTVLLLRLVVARDGKGPSKQTVDTLDCAVWNGRLRQRMRPWQAGDILEIRGSIRRRFFQTGHGAQSRVEIEVHEAHRLKRS